VLYQCNHLSIIITTTSSSVLLGDVSSEIYDVLEVTNGQLAVSSNTRKTIKSNTTSDEVYDFFLLFADETTSVETCGGGRYLYSSRPDENNETFINFNKSYTAFCGFSSFATRLLPWKENTIPIEIKTRVLQLNVFVDQNIRNHS
jgi:hypothetical protein